jgi:hypothetical protein
MFPVQAGKNFPQAGEIEKADIHGVGSEGKGKSSFGHFFASILQVRQAPRGGPANGLRGKVNSSPPVSGV